MSTPACAAAQARDVEMARRTREAARRSGIHIPVRTGVSREDAEGAGEDLVPLVRLDTPMEEDGPQENGAGVPTSGDAPLANEAGPGNPPPTRSPTPVPPPAADKDAGNEAGGGEGVWGGDAGECGAPVIEEFPEPRAGQPINDSQAEPFDLRAYMASVGPFASPADFEVAELLLTTKMTNDARDKHLKSRKYRGVTPWPHVGALMRALDTLPHGPKWKAVKLSVGEGDDARVVVVFIRDVIEVLRELIGNPRFKRYMRYAPERHWTSNALRKRVFGEMWTGDWWWNMQMLLSDPQGTIAPLIVASDKTSVSTISGDQKVYPVYLTIGNISKRIRRKSKNRAQILIGYLPVEDFKDVENDKERERLKGELVHRSMEILLEPLKQAGKDGVEMFCADGRLRRVYPILAAYIADYPEQSLMACTSQGRCPICVVSYRRRARYRRNLGQRRRKHDLKALRSYLATEDLAELDERGLKPWWPFWAHLPHAEFAGSITPDLLHQLHKGMFKSHLVKWVSRVLGKKVVDKRMAAMTRASGMRHFRIGISSVEKWTGRESKEMGMQFLPVVAETMTDDLVRLTRAMLDHMYRAHAARMTEDELGEMEDAWREFHRLKPSLVASGALKSMASFNRISKLHTVGHWPGSIRQLGTPDGYNSEAPEHLHIEYAKEPWRCSNGVDPLPQMIKFIQRQEAVRIHRAHLDAWLALIRRQLAIEDEDGDGSDDGGGEYDDDDEWEDVEGDSEDVPHANTTHYPKPQLAIAASPTCRNLSANQIVARYKATELIPTLTRFLESAVAAARGQTRPSQLDRLRVPYLTGHTTLNVWHRFALNHAPLPFAPDEPRRRDVVRARPATHNAFGLEGRLAAFDTVLYEDPSVSNTGTHGLHRYRAARVRVIFRPPNVAHHIYSEHLAYIEFFNPFSQNNSTPHGLYTTSTALHSDGRRQVAVVPISHLRMTCHIAPRFARVNPDVPLHYRTDLFTRTRHFLFNHYMNYYVFKLFEHWRKRAQWEQA
ncbi:hypothetical protein FRC10_000258 [Ceratobasidium sp. 414]|nr:hypothetical protein FRC10_000258 [Ceratobasidium sp. 414]